MFIYSVRYLYIPRCVYIFRAVFIISPQYIYSPRGVYYISRGIYKYAWTFLNASGKIILTQMAPHKLLPYRAVFRNEVFIIYTRGIYYILRCEYEYIWRGICYIPAVFIYTAWYVSYIYREVLGVYIFRAVYIYRSGLYILHGIYIYRAGLYIPRGVYIFRAVFIYVARCLLYPLGIYIVPVVFIISTAVFVDTPGHF